MDRLKNGPIFLVSEAPSHQIRILQSCLNSQGHEVRELLSIPDTPYPINQEFNTLIIIVDTSQHCDPRGIKKAEQIRQRYPHVPIILITSHSSEQLAIAALKTGINDYFKNPFSLEELSASIKQLLSQQNRYESSIKNSAIRSDPTDDLAMIGRSKSMQMLKASLRQITQSDSTVLITGETGTGKDLLANLIHRNSRRHGHPFVSVNCAAIPETLFESELFGYEKGAFTGAEKLRKGTFEQAEGGTILLDEIGDLDVHSQTKLLRVLESKEIHRLGGRKYIPFNARIIAATNQELDELVEKRKFRSDLYYRLNVARMHLPPLRDRREDIPLLLDHYLTDSKFQSDQVVDGFSRDALKALLAYKWPGNVRELRNFLEATFVGTPSRIISFEDFPEHIKAKLGESQSSIEAEQRKLIHALVKTQWNKSRAAQALNWSRMTLYRKMDKYGITKVFH